MTPSAIGLSDVAARIAAIEARFTPPSGFAATLASAQEQSPAATTADAAAGQDASATAPAGQTLTAAPAVAIPASAVPSTSALTPSAYAIRIGDVSGAGFAAAASSVAAGDWASRLPAAGRRWAGAIESAAAEAGVDPTLLAALVWAESGFRADAGSGAGAMGLTQLMPGTARGLGVDPHDPVQNLRGGARYLAQQLDRFGSPALALAAYNAGPGAVAEHGGIPPYSETRAYVPRVLGYQQQLKGA